MVFMLLASWFALGARPAAAKPKTRAVSIETTPAGATVYVGDIESGAKGQTPLTLDLPLGDTTLVLELAGYETRFEVVKVVAPGKRDKKKPQPVAFELVAAQAQLSIVEPDGAAVMIDGEDVGTVPLSIAVAPGTHTVKVIAPGRRPYVEELEFVAGELRELEPVFPAEPVATDDDKPLPPPPPPPAPAVGPPALRVMLGAQFGLRRFRYTGRTTLDTLREFDQTPAPAGRLEVEVGVGRLAGVKALRPLQLRLGAALSAPQTVDSGGSLGDMKTGWRQLHADLRYGIPAGPVAIAVGAGLVSDRYDFTGPAEATAVVPSARYLALRGQVGVERRGGRIAPYAHAEYRLVFDGGKFGDRFESASVTGLGADAGVDIQLPAKLVLRVDGALQLASWSLTPRADGVYVATAAQDVVATGAVLLGRAF